MAATTRGAKRAATKHNTTRAQNKTRARDKQNARSGETEAQAQARMTTDHDEIRRWVQERGGHPAQVRGTARGKGIGMIRIDYPGYSGGDTLEKISWDEFFTKFDRAGLAFLYQDKTKDGDPSRFSKFVERNPTKG